MGILNWLFSGGAQKSDLSDAIINITEMALLETERQELLPRKAALWEALCSEASDLMTQLLVRRRLSDLDWGFEGKGNNLNQSQVVTIFWWMLLYELVLFKTKGVEGFDKAEEFTEMYATAEKFVQNVVATSENGASTPVTWGERWKSQVGLEAAMGIYNAMSLLLDQRIDPQSRIMQVSNFTTATERAYQEKVSKAVADRIAGQ